MMKVKKTAKKFGNSAMVIVPREMMGKEVTVSDQTEAALDYEYMKDMIRQIIKEELEKIA